MANQQKQVQQDTAYSAVVVNVSPSPPISFFHVSTYPEARYTVGGRVELEVDRVSHRISDTINSRTRLRSLCNTEAVIIFDPVPPPKWEGRRSSRPF